MAIHQKYKVVVSCNNGSFRKEYKSTNMHEAMNLARITLARTHKYIRDNSSLINVYDVHGHIVESWSLFGKCKQLRDSMSGRRMNRVVLNVPVVHDCTRSRMDTVKASPYGFTHKLDPVTGLPVIQGAYDGIVSRVKTSKYSR